MQELYNNKNYLVRFSEDSEDVELQYEVVNKETGAVEYESQSLPQALTICEQFSYILEKELWKADAMFGDEVTENFMADVLQLDRDKH